MGWWDHGFQVSGENEGQREGSCQGGCPEDDLGGSVSYVYLEYERF